MNQITINRETGTKVELGHESTFGIDNEGFPWITYCMDHELFIGHKTKQLAIRWSSKPSGWCDECAKMGK